MKLVLHIGTEKTATTTIQDFVYANRRALAAHGVALCDSLGRTNNRKLVAYLMPDDRFDDYFKDRQISTVEGKRQFFDGFEDEFRAEVRALSRSAHTLFITSEHFHSRLKEVDSILRLKRLLDDLFTDVEIVCYFREQSSMLQSLYSTAVKSGNVVAFGQFTKQCAVNSHYYNFHQFFDKWRQVFGAQSLRARLFDRERFVGHDIRKDILSLILPTQDFDGFDLSVADANVSLGYAGLEIGRVVNRRLGKYDPDGSRNALRQHLIEVLMASRIGQTGVLPFPNARAIHARFDESNTLFAREFLGLDGNPFPRPRNRPLAGHRTSEQVVTLSDVLRFVDKALQAVSEGGAGASATASATQRRRAGAASPTPAKAGDSPHWRRRLDVLARRLRGRA